MKVVAAERCVAPRLADTFSSVITEKQLRLYPVILPFRRACIGFSHCKTTSRALYVILVQFCGAPVGTKKRERGNTGKQSIVTYIDINKT